MTQLSWFWDDTTVGDATQAPYSATEFSAFLRYLLNADRTTQGPIGGVDNELAVSGAASPITIDTGAALILGKLFTNDAATTLAVAAPAVDPRIDLVVLQADIAAQTIRVALHAGVEGGGAPAATQTAAVWEVPIAQITVTTAGVITVTDVREFARSPLGAGAETAQLAANDSAHADYAWSDIGTTYTGITLTAGKWLLFGILNYLSAAAAGEREARLYNANSTVVHAWSSQYADTVGYKYTIPIGPVVIDLTAANVIKLNFLGGATDTVIGDATAMRTGLTAIRIPNG